MNAMLYAVSGDLSRTRIFFYHESSNCKKRLSGHKDPEMFHSLWIVDYEYDESMSVCSVAIESFLVVGGCITGSSSSSLVSPTEGTDEEKAGD